MMPTPQLGQRRHQSLPRDCFLRTWRVRGDPKLQWHEYYGISAGGDRTEERKTSAFCFVCDGMTTNLIPAACVVAHKSIKGGYQLLMAMDQFPALGHRMTRSLDSFITDSANSATALYTGHKSSVSDLGVYADCSSDSFDDPKLETIAELFVRILGQ